MDIEKLNLKYEYCADSGLIKYRVKTRYHSPGDVAGRICKTTGYVRIASKCGRCNSIHAHRLAWLLYYGRLPKSNIDHINGVKDDNRITNLREATHAENLQNIRCRQRKKYPSLPMGVCFHKGTGKYQAKIKLNYKTRWLGYFDCPMEAEKAYLSAKRSMHPFSTL